MNIYFIGGSITEGAGAKEYENSYAALVSKYLKSSYEEETNILNLGAGGTASNFGIFRVAEYFEKQKTYVVFRICS